MSAKTLIVKNAMSGHSETISPEILKQAFVQEGQPYDIVTLESPDQDYSVKGYTRLIVTGGDGTIHNAINKCKFRQDMQIVYIPSGTLNERSKVSEIALTKSKRQKKKEEKEKNKVKVRRLRAMGMANNYLFSYVFAAGSFTEIAYKTKTKYKKKFKALAYIWKVLAAYKVFKIPATLNCKCISDDVKTLSGNFSLIMVLDSERCFGFRFNRAYRENDDRMHLLTIRTTGKNNIIGKIRLFFPFFRAFFMGFNEEYHSKYIDFMPITNIDLKLGENTVFCVDGERREFDGEVDIEKLQIMSKLYIVQKR